MPDQREKFDRKIIPRGHVYKVSTKYWLIINYPVKIWHLQPTRTHACHLHHFYCGFVPTTLWNSLLAKTEEHLYLLSLHDNLYLDSYIYPPTYKKQKD